MISDVLSEAVSEIDRYLRTEQAFAGVYGHEGEPLFDRIVELREEMEAMRTYLDDPLPVRYGQQASDLHAIAEAKASLFLVGLPKGTEREERIVHRAYYCGWLQGNQYAVRKGEEA